jgi:molybdenum ABC transporter molybdate-binding protein
MNRHGAWIAFLGSIVVFAALVALLAFPSLTSPPGGSEPVFVLCAAGIRVPVESAAEAYRKEVGAEIQFTFGPSQTLLADAEIKGIGDLYLAADESYIELARRKRLVEEAVPVARMKPVLAVKAGNPKKIATLRDLERADVQLVVANPEAAAVGKLVREALGKAGRWAPLGAKAATKPDVNQVGMDVGLGAADAGFVWDATVLQLKGIEAVTLPELGGLESHVTVGVLRSAKSPAAALRFARWLAAPEKGVPEFARAGFTPAGGDAWTPAPELRLSAGAMLRGAIEKTIVAFEKREGVRVVPTYNGCGILVAAMKAGERPDVYFACETSFMTQVKDQFESPVDISLNQLVILVQKGNPRGLKALRDLAKDGLRVGVGHQQQCALGALTQEALRQSKVLPDVMKNVVVETPAGDMLVNQMITGSLDAAVTYLSNAARAGDRFEAVPIDIPCAFAAQPIAVARETPRKRLAERFVAAILSDLSRERFLQEGFRWKAE